MQAARMRAHSNVSCQYHVAALTGRTATRRASLTLGTSGQPRKPFRRLEHVQFKRGEVPEVEQPTDLPDANVGSAPEADSQSTTHAFSWTTRWWPVMPLEALDAKIPLKVDLLGKSLVVWADSHGTWHCLEDRCPHRLAPLSEGRVEGDTLMCSYHGWQFSSSGACTRIPQLDHDPKAQASACSSKRSCAKSYPARLERGMLWVWPESGPAASLQAQAQPVLDVPGVEAGMCAWFVRDLPIRWDTLVENLLDPSHVPFAHHGMAGNRNKLSAISRAWNTMQCSPIKAEGFVASAESPTGPQSWVYEAPFCSKMHFGTGNGVFLQHIMVPTRPGWSRLMANASLMPQHMPEPMKSIFKVTQSLPGLTHLLLINRSFDGDTYLLHLAERQLPVSGGIGSDAAARAYYLPAQADASVLALRAWIQRFGGEVPTCAPRDQTLMPPLMPKEKALDRWEQHTKNCAACKATLAAVDKALLASQGLGAITAVAAVVQLVLAAAAGTALLQPQAIACLVAALACAALHKGLSGLRTKFYYEDYTHALMD